MKGARPRSAIRSLKPRARAPFLLRRKLRPMRLQRGQHEFAQSLALFFVEVLKDLSPHARFPETSDVVGNSIGTFLLIPFGLEERPDVVREMNKMMWIHTTSISSAAEPPATP